MSEKKVTGWKLVPPELTDDMKHAASHINNSVDRADMNDMYRAMVAAAPVPPLVPATDLMDGVLDDLVELLWANRTKFHEGELMPQLQDFSRALLAVVRSQS